MGDATSLVWNFLGNHTGAAWKIAGEAGKSIRASDFAATRRVPQADITGLMHGVFNAQFRRVIQQKTSATVLHPDFIDRVVDAVFADNPDAERLALLDERKRLATEATNLTTAIAAGGDIPALVKELQARDRKLNDLDAKRSPLSRPTVTCCAPRYAYEGRSGATCCVDPTSTRRASSCNT